MTIKALFSKYITLFNYSNTYITENNEIRLKAFKYFMNNGLSVKQ